jgi:CBS domain-containing protein
MRDDFIEEELQIAQERTDHESQLLTQVLQQPVGELTTLQPAVVLAPQATLRTALNIMLQEAVSCVLIVEHDSLIGVFTERDVLAKVATQGLDLDHTPISACMTRQPAYLERDYELAYALHEMSLGGHRHIPLVDTAGRPVALVSMRAVVEALSAAFPQEMVNLPPIPPRPRTAEGA